MRRIRRPTPSGVTVTSCYGSSGGTTDWARPGGPDCRGRQMFDLDLLRLFIKVAEEGSIAAAARAEGISPSFASRRVTALEQALNSRLVLRTTRNLRLTNAGEACLAWARDTLNRHDRLIDELSSLQSE